jgi:hypothetical protein
VIIGLGHGVSIAKTLEAFPVGLYDLLIDERKLFLQPREEGGTEVETDGSIVVGDIENLPLLIDDSGIPIGTVALEGDPFIPVVEGMGALLSLDGSEPWIFPGRLIEVTVDGNECVFHSISILTLEPVEIRIKILDLSISG